jgi:tetratricopeptide (TPR) repeat protein
MAKKRKRPHTIPEPSQDPQVLYLSEFEITDSPILDRRYRRLPRQIQETIEQLYDTAQKEPLQAIPQILELIKKYPYLPTLYNYLSVAYSMAGQIQAAQKVVEENYRRNPDYLFARLNYAEMLLNEGDFEQVPEVFAHKFDLKMLYPNRKRFHISEVTGFMGIMGWYFLETGERETAERYYEFLRQIAPDHPMTRRLHRKLRRGWLRRLFPRQAR